MVSFHSPVQSEFEEPILFRTTSCDVYQSTLSTGSLWLRSDRYYRAIEDSVRQDFLEGGNYGKAVLPLRFKEENAPNIQLEGPGHVGEQLPPHYILSLHGASILEEQRIAFGGCTFGIKSVVRLTAEIVYRCGPLLKCVGYRYGPVRYQFGTLSRSRRGDWRTNLPCC